MPLRTSREMIAQCHYQRVAVRSSSLVTIYVSFLVLFFSIIPLSSSPFLNPRIVCSALPCHPLGLRAVLASNPFDVRLTPFPSPLFSLPFFCCLFSAFNPGVSFLPPEIIDPQPNTLTQWQICLALGQAFSLSAFFFKPILLPLACSVSSPPVLAGLAVLGIVWGVVLTAGQCAPAKSVRTTEYNVQ